MRIVGAEFTRSCVALEQFPPDRGVEFAIVGRSNVGKSSLINRLVQQKRLAHVSRTPGKTQAVNFFDLQTTDRALSPLRLVDLPGYGYARVSKALRAQWGPLIQRYLQERRSLACVLFLIDARGSEPTDVATFEWLRSLNLPVIVVITKIDKLKRGERAPSDHCSNRNSASSRCSSPTSVRRPAGSLIWRRQYRLPRS